MTIWLGFSEPLGLWVLTPARPTFFPTIDKSHCDKRHSSSTNELSVYVEKQPVALKECCMKYWCEKAKKHMSRWSGRLDMTEFFLKTALNPNQSINDLGLMLFSTFFYFMVASSPIPGFLTSSPHNRLSKQLAAFLHRPLAHWRKMNDACPSDFLSNVRKNVGKARVWTHNHWFEHITFDNYGQIYRKSVKMMLLLLNIVEKIVA